MKVSRRLRHLALAALAMIAAGVPAAPPLAQADEAFKVVVHSSYPQSSIGRDELTRVFLKRVEHWVHGAKAAPIDLPVTAPAREGFSQAVHGRRASAIKSYWQQQIYSGRGVPPPEAASDEEVVAFVRANPGAVGYVSASARTDGVKVVEVRD